MNILLTNDDGYNSDGIVTIYNTLKEKHDVFLSAPLTQKSAAGHSITLFTPLRIEKVEGGYAVDGTPADCVKIALFEFLKNKKIDLVVSGINNGSNMGSDIFYSGTVAAAREGLINDISAIACSMDRPATLENLHVASKFISNMIDEFDEKLMKEKFIFNINFPSSSKFAGARVTHLGQRVYNDTIYIENKNGLNYASIVGNGVSFMHNEGSDLNCVDSGYVSITPLNNEYFIPPVVNQLYEIVIKIDNVC